MRWLFIGCIALYRRLLSPLKPACCRFSPTCSEYAIEAFKVHGTIKGSVLTSYRILRCQPFGCHGYDPVPPKGKWHHPDRQLQR